MIILALLLLTIFVGLLWLIVSALICPHYYDAKHIKNKIDFDSVQKFYPINPHKWQLDEGYVMYNYTTQFRFNFIDYWRYRSWLKRQRKYKAMEAQNDALAAVIKDVKEDISKYKAKNVAYVQSKIDEILLSRK